MDQESLILATTTIVNPSILHLLNTSQHPIVLQPRTLADFEHIVLLNCLEGDEVIASDWKTVCFGGLFCRGPYKRQSRLSLEVNAAPIRPPYLINHCPRIYWSNCAS